MENFGKVIEAAKKSLATEEISKSILNRVLIDSIREYQQKLNIGIQDSAMDLLDNFKVKIKDEIFNISNSWKPYNREVFCLFPQNCRFFFSKGPFDLVAIEEKPQLRTVRFVNRGLCGLHIPYSIFVFVFKNSKFKAMYNGWRKTPLNSLEDDVYQPLLPNIHSSLEVCTGEIPEFEESSICKSVEYLIDYFWQSNFHPEHLATTFKKVSVDDWKNNVDYAFDFDLKKVSSLKKIIEDAYHVPDVESKLHHKLSKNVDELVELLFKKVMSYFQHKKFEKHYPQDLLENMNEAIDYVSKEYNLAIAAMESQIITQENFGWEKAGNYWNG